MASRDIVAKPLRRDAKERRDRLIVAAAQCFNEGGFNVPLEEIMARADVGRGTFYRNFKDRMALVLAIFEREIENLDVRAVAGRSLTGTITSLVYQNAEASRLFARLSSEMTITGEDFAAFQALGDRFTELVEPVVKAAHARGEIDRSLGGRQLALSLRMLGSLLHPISNDAATRADVTEAIDLIVRGLKPTHATAK